MGERGEKLSFLYIYSKWLQQPKDSNVKINSIPWLLKTPMGVNRVLRNGKKKKYIYIYIYICIYMKGYEQNTDTVPYGIY